MNPAVALVPAALGAAVGAGLVARRARHRGLDRWLGPYLAQTFRRTAPRPGRPVHVLLAIADHYEPHHGRPAPEVARRRVANWVEQYPLLFARFRDADGRPPRHTFFYPIDEYDADAVDAVAGLCRAGYGEIEIHLHHDRDTAEALRDRLLQFKALFAERHGLLPTDQRTGERKYGFVHGNWALDNSRPDGRWCGVNNELDVLRETGCYADFTLPSAPSATQTPTINSIYYASDDPCRPRSHDRGIPVGIGPKPACALMLVQGPLLFDWGRRKWGLAPRVENGCIQKSQPPDPARVDLWLRACVRVPTRPDWYFVKLHTHGATETNQEVILGEPMVRFHESLARRAANDPNFHVHYVTAREMYNLACAAEAGWTGSVAGARDYRLVWNGSPAAVPGRHEGTGCAAVSCGSGDR